MVRLDRFRIVKLSEELRQEYDLPEAICADPESMPFLEGDAFYQWLVEENACEPITAYNYLSLILPFLSFLWDSSPSLRYTAPTEQIRTQVKRYLKEKLGCTVRPHSGGNLVVKPSGVVSIHSARLFLTAIKRFYMCAILKGWYTDPSPLVWTSRLVAGEREFKPHMPPRSGMVLPDERRGRIPDTYFCAVAGEWQPRILDDPNLPQLLLAAFTNSRDRLITRILFESGARVSEVLGLTIGDWRSRQQRERALAANKGSRGARVKEIWWSSTTARLLHNYLNHDRCQCDPQGRRMDDLPDSARIFITDKGKGYTYAAFYFNWQVACQKANLKVTPHQARHWFVTMALRKFEALPTDKREAARQSLIAYLGWRNPETLKAYDHHLRKMGFAATHAALSQLVDAGDPSVRVSPDKVTRSEGGTIPSEMWERLSQILDN
jgi:hypothetical protein